MRNNNTIEGKILTRISRMKSRVVLREDFTDLGGYDQVGRTLLKLARKGKILKIGYGLYAKTKISSMTGEVLPIQSLPALAKEALNRLGVEVNPTKAEVEYLAGRSTQIPTGKLIGVKNRISRKIGYKEISINYERVSRI
ncbi:DUF6088 family protein [Flavitalea flava]